MRRTAMVSRKNSETLYEQVVKEIENRIMSGVYRKGQLLPSEKELIDELGVSRITIRKALSILSGAGIIETSRGRGSVVLFDTEALSGSGTLADYAQGYIQGFRSVAQIRILLEPEVAREIALHATEEQVAELRECLSGVKTTTPFQKEEFHRKLVEFMDNPELLKIYDNLISVESSQAPAGVISPEKQNDIAAKLDRQHVKILKAIENHDGEFAYFYMKEHTRFIIETFERHFKYLF